MKRLLTLLALIFSPLFAFECYEEPACWSFAGEWLYFMPSFDQSEFIWDGPSGIGATPQGLTNRLGEKQKYYSAYRVEGAYAFCEGRHNFVLRYTNFHQNYQDSLDFQQGNQILGLSVDAILTNSEQGDVAFERDYRYYTIDGLFGLYKGSYCGFSPSFSAGVKFTHLHIKEKANYNDITDGVRQFVEPDMSAWALGPAATFDGLFSFTNCFSVVGRCQLSFLACQNVSKLTITGDAANPDNKILIENSPRYWHAIRGATARLGLNFSRWCTIPFYCSSFHFDFEGGYELIKDENICSRIYSVDNTSQGFSFNEWSDFTLTGPYLRINVTY